jgi:signal transduction histidine kinase/ActR/RegA family two-component response regulator
VTQPLCESLEPMLSQSIERVKTSGLPELLTADGHADSLLVSPVPFPGNRFAHGLIVVPLTARGRNIAVLVLAACDSRRRFDADTLSIARDLANRAAVAVDNALLYGAIQESDQRKNEFLAMLAHELRNPLAPIGNAIHVLRAVDHDRTQVAWALDMIGRQFQQLTRLVDDLLDLSRITRGKIELKIETLDVGDVVTAAVETSRPVIDANRHTLNVLLPDEPLRVRGDFARLAQVLANILNNAAKYTAPGGRIALTVTHEGEDVAFRIRDNGVGIPRHYLSRIFEPFLQIDRTIDRSQGGLGIGLTLVRQLIERQGGTVTAYSEGADQGSEFTVRLPLARVPAIEATAPIIATSPRPAASGVSVLVVDDNRDVAQSTAVVLRVSGCSVQLAHDGKSALEMLTRVRPDAVLLDIGLPGMNGYEVARAIRSQPEHRATLIVAVSGYGQEEYQQRSREAGFDHHLVKPIDPAVLLRLLASLSRPGAAGSNVVALAQRRANE